MNLPKASGIYRIYCYGNQCHYIGSSTNILKRCQKHVRDLNKGIHPNSFLQSAYKKYGTDNFIFELVELTSREKLLLLEDYYLQCSDPEKLFNMNKSASSPRLGMIPWNKGKKGVMTHSDDSKKLISENNSKYWKGKLRSDISTKLTGHQVSDDTKKKISNSLKDRPLSDETKKKMKGRIPWNKGKKGVQIAWNKGLTKQDYK
jgi:group I intron endonuclease